VDFERDAPFAERMVTGNAPGFMIWDALPDHQAERLDFRNAGLGGPASSVPGARTIASAEELNKVLDLYALGFVVAEDGRQDR